MRGFLEITTILVVFSSALLCSAAETDTPGTRPLMDAVKAGDLGGVRKALQQNRDANASEADGTTALHRAVQLQRLDILQALIAAGANVNAKNAFGITPLAFSLTNGNSAISVQLIKALGGGWDSSQKYDPPR